MALAAAHRLRQGLGPESLLLAVLRPEQNELGRLLASAGYRVVISDDARAGMGRTLALGVAASPQASGWLVALADMPRLRPATIARVADALRGGASLAAPVYRGQRGHPVGFARPWREALLALDGDMGARQVLTAAGAALLSIDSDDPGVVLDVDTPHDLAMLSADPTD